MDNNDEGDMLDISSDNAHQGLPGRSTNSGSNDNYASGENTFEQEFGDKYTYEAGNVNGTAEIAINGLEDMGNIDFKNLSATILTRYRFLNVGVAFTFYHWYARLNGFAARKSKVRRNKDKEIIQQNFVCYRQGFREERFGEERSRQRRPRNDTRCGCNARCIVHIDYDSGWWYVRHFNDVHNHLLVDTDFVGFLPAHRRMDDDDIMQMKKFRKVGISTPQIYRTYASQLGGYANVGFLKHDMYNEIDKERRRRGSDARGALAYLRELKSGDPNMYWKHTVNAEGRLKLLFWCDGKSRLDYSIFGDVLAFDASYKKNKYKLPLVVFSGVNNHNQTIIFASAFVSQENEETYVWLLEQFVDAMRGKLPISVITDGDVAMKNAIRRVFPDIHHRLCAWHLIRNATTNMKNPRFTSLFKRCMLVDYEIGDFERKWQEMVLEFGVEEHRWVRETYEKKEMWATAHIRRKFFAGFRTTSCCEGLHSQLGKFVDVRNNLVEFLQHFKMCMEFLRFKEVEADFASLHGQQVLLTEFPLLERSASRLYTKEVFLLFRAVLKKATAVRVVAEKKTTTAVIYFLTKYCYYGNEWHVTFSPSTMSLKCSCLRMESLGIPCEHIVCVLFYKNMVDIPQSLVLERWTKNVKDSVKGLTQSGESG